MEKIGLDAKLYRSGGEWGSGSWSEITSARDVTLNLEQGTAEVAKRGMSWKQYLAALKDASIEFELAYDGSDANFTALKTAFMDGTKVEMAVMDGDIAATGSQGLHAEMIVTNFSRNEPLEEILTVSVTLKPAASEHEPEWMTT